MMAIVPRRKPILPVIRRMILVAGASLGLNAALNSLVSSCQSAPRQDLGHRY
jgi:hypothetical protein